MAANMKEVKLRIKSVENTMQITRAMELVASSKLRGAKERAETCRPYFQELYETLREIAAGNTDFSSVYAAPSGGGRCCYVLIGGDRGLAEVQRQPVPVLEEAAGDGDYSVLPIGKKAVEYVRRRKLDCVTEQFGQIADISVSDCFEIASLLCREFASGRFGMWPCATPLLSPC